MLSARKPAGLPTWLEGQGFGWMAAPLDGRLRFEHWAAIKAIASRRLAHGID